MYVIENHDSEWHYGMYTVLHPVHAACYSMMYILVYIYLDNRCTRYIFMYSLAKSVANGRENTCRMYM